MHSLAKPAAPIPNAVPALSNSASTIAAISTPPGVGALAIIRLSGPHSRAVAGRLLPSRAAGRLADGAPRIISSFHDPRSGEPIDQGIVQCFSAPRSYTGEDVVELHGHGGRIAPGRVLDAVLHAGAVQALPGEFTRRALLNGKMDLLQAEGLLDLIGAPSEGLYRQALYQLAGALSQSIAQLRESLVEVMALLELQIDFAEEDVLIPSDWLERVRQVRRQAASLLTTYRVGGVLRHGIRVVIAGTPNVGKSRLFNLLLGEERSIVTAHPGTTRDAIEAELALGGFLFRLVDTAGIREAREEIEAIGVDLARKHLQGAQIVLLLLEATRPPNEQEEALMREVSSRPHVLVLTKCDLVDARERAQWVLGGSHLHAPALEWCAKVNSAPFASVNSEPRTSNNVIPTSAQTGEGRDTLLGTILRLGTRDLKFVPESPVITRLRHKYALEKCLEDLDRGLEELSGSAPAPEKAAADLRSAADALAEVTGLITHEDVLDRVFSEFCIGK